MRDYFHQHNHQADSSCFSLIGSAPNSCHLKLKASLLILKLKSSLNVSKKSMPLYLFDDNTQFVNYQFC